MAVAAASTQQAADYKKRRQPTRHEYGLLAQRLCSIVANDEVLGGRMTPTVYYGRCTIVVISKVLLPKKCECQVEMFGLLCAKC
jgi:hypothetical protein